MCCGDRISLASLMWVRIGVLLSLLAMLFGVVMGLAFGAAESSLKAGLNARGTAVLTTTYKGDNAKLKAVVAKAWAYYKRAHLHAGAMGAAALAICLLLAALGGYDRLRMLVSLAVGFGACGYALFWLLAGMRAPRLGGTHLAKESLNWLAMPSAGLYTLGVLAAIALVIRVLFWPTPSPDASASDRTCHHKSP